MAAIPFATAAFTPLWVRDAQISPDGKSIVFAYKGDLWLVSSAGGQATRLTTSADYDGTPVWSPDSRQIAFASNRHGNDDVYIMDATGGPARRLTYNSAAETPEAFTPDGKHVVYSASIQAPTASVQFPTSRLSQLYEVPADGKGAPRQSLGVTAQKISYIPDGKGKYLYQDVKGMENEWRKHQHSSVARDIWLYDPASGRHTNLTHREAEDRNPVATKDGYYYLSERDGGSMNVYYSPLSDPSQARAITTFRDHPVRFLSMSDTGTLCYTYDGELYTQSAGGKPSKVAIEITDDYANTPYKLSVPKPSEMTVSPDGKYIAFISRGDVFVTSVEYATTKQISKTPEAETWIAWGDDSKSLYYTSERDGKYTIYKASMGRADDPNIVNATIIEEAPVIKTDSHERAMPKISPDGKKMAFVLDRNIIAVRDMESGKVKNLTDGSTYKQRDGDLKFYWSPDSKWLALEVTDRDPYTDIAILNVEDGTLKNITRSGYFDQQPRWTADGNAILFASEKYGMRNHASWGSMYDVMMVFVNQDAYDNYKLNKEDAEIDKEAKKNLDDDDEDDKTINVELDGIEDRVVRLTPFSSDLLDYVLNADGETLYFLTKSDGNNMLWTRDMREGKVEMLKTVPSTLRAFETSADGKKIFMLGSAMQQFNPSNQKLTPITYSGTMTIDPEAERQFMFDNIVREEAQRFYDKGMHGVDWPKLTDHYRQFLPHINNNHDFTEMLSEMLGELNVSHTGARMYSSSTSNSERTASLGLLYDMTWTGDGLKVTEVLPKGPFGNAGSKVKPGVIIESINGEKITPQNDYTTLLTDIAGQKTLVTIYDPATKERWDEVVKPISSSAMSDLMYKRWVDARAADVDRWSNGRLGYVHIKSMNDAAFRELYSQALGKYNDREGIVVDIRWNGGGRLHEDVEAFLTGEKYLTQMIRGQRSCDMPSRRWNKPSVMLMSEACYSNAHGTPWVYKHQGIGKLVGMPVPGTMTSVNWVDMQDPNMYYGIPVVGYLTAEGNYLENSQLEPDVKVTNSPEDLLSGEDRMLRTAVETLLNDLKTTDK